MFFSVSEVLLLECSLADRRVGWIFRTAESLLASRYENTDNIGAQHKNITTEGAARAIPNRF